MHKKLIAILDDSKSIRESLCAYLQVSFDIEIEVHTFSSTEDFMAFAVGRKIDLLITDLALKENSRAVPAMIINFKAQQPQVKIVVMSAYNESGRREVLGDYAEQVGSAMAARSGIDMGLGQGDRADSPAARERAMAVTRRTSWTGAELNRCIDLVLGRSIGEAGKIIDFFTSSVTEV